jgi:hypothetical protein
MMTGEAAGLPGRSNYRFFDGCEMKILHYFGSNDDWGGALAGQNKNAAQLT